jgi:hypothetical protein
LTQIVEAAKLPTHQQTERFMKLEAALHKQAIITRLLAPAMLKVGEAHLRCQSILRCTQAGLACERFRIEHTRWPKSLDELVEKGQLAAVPDDPHDGKPLRLARWGEGIAIYSVGKDLRDDGGANVKLFQTNDGKQDLGVRLWDAVRRRQPPRPPVAIDEGFPP